MTTDSPDVSRTTAVDSAADALDEAAGPVVGKRASTQLQRTSGTVRRIVLTPAFLGSLMGLVGFRNFQHFRIVFPTNVNEWIVGDWGNFMMAPLHYRNSSLFTFPLGQVPNLGYPTGTSLLYTDSIPLLGLIFRPFDALLPQDFQFLGLYLLAGYILQGAFGALIASRFVTSRLAITAAAGLFVFTPAFVVRNVHTALTAHWIMLAVIYAALKGARSNRWGLVTLICATALIHPYIWMFCVVMLVGVLLDDLRSMAARWRAILASVAVTIAGSGFLLALVGAFVTEYQSPIVGFGSSQANLITFIAGDGWATYFNLFSSAPGQTEGFAYLGLGTIVLVGGIFIGAPVMLWLKRGEDARASIATRSLLRTHLGLVIACVVLFIYAMSNHVFIGSRELVNLSVIYDRLTPITTRFRSSGRAAWPLMYLILALAIGALGRVTRRARRPNAVAATALVVCFGLQYVDVAFPDRHVQVVDYYHQQTVATPIDHLVDGRWSLMDDDDRYDHMNIYHAILWGCGDYDGAPGYFTGYVTLLSLEAYRADLTFNSGFPSRPRTDAAASCSSQNGEAAAGNIDSRTIYVLTDPQYAPPPNTQCGVLDGFRVCVLDTNDDAFARSL